MHDHNFVVVFGVYLRDVYVPIATLWPLHVQEPVHNLPRAPTVPQIADVFLQFVQHLLARYVCLAACMHKLCAYNKPWQALQRREPVLINVHMMNECSLRNLAQQCLHQDQ